MKERNMKTSKTIRRTSKNRYIVREPGRSPYVAMHCLSCPELMHADLIEPDGDCKRCKRTNAA